MSAMRTFREFGNALVGLGRRLRIGAELETIGKKMRSVAREIEEDDLVALRRPIDDLRALVNQLATTTTDLRAVLDELVTAVGVDN